MSNPYYSYSGAFIPGTLGRAEAVAAEFQSVQAGFADLAVAGTDTGSATAYVVATPAGQPAAPLVDGDQVSFKAANTNSGQATINVNGSGVLPLLQYNGSQLQAANITANSWYVVTYNSTYGGWCLPGAVAITFTGSISSAAPVYPVQLTAVGGSSTSAMPIDAKLAISTAISPTWVGNHSFTGTSSFSGPLTIGGTSTISGPLTVSGITTHSAGVSFTAAASFSGTATVSGVLAVSGTSTFSGPHTVSGTSTFSAPITVTASSSFSGAFVASGTGTYSGPLSLTNVTRLLVTSGTSSFAGAILVSGTATFSGPLTVTGTSSFANVALSGNPLYVGAPVKTVGTAYTLVLSDQNTTIFGTATAAKTYTIPSNASVAFPAQTMITFANGTAGTGTVAITSDVMYLAGGGGTSTGTRILAPGAIAVAVKLLSTVWYISGAGVT